MTMLYDNAPGDRGLNFSEGQRGPGLVCLSLYLPCSLFLLCSLYLWCSPYLSCSPYVPCSLLQTLVLNSCSSVAFMMTGCTL